MSVEDIVEKTAPKETAAVPLLDRAGARQALAELVAGSRTLMGLGWAWVTKPGGRETLERLGYTAAGGYLVVRVVAGTGDTVQAFVGPGLVVGWCVAAWMYSPAQEKASKARKARKAADAAVTAPPVSAEPEGQEPRDVGQFDVDPVDLPELVGLVVTVAAKYEHQGAHLADVLAAGELDGWTVTDLRTAFEDFGVPVADQLGLKFPGRPRPRNRPGVRLRDLPQHLLEAPAEAGERGPSGRPETAPATPAGSAPEGPVERSAGAVAEGG
ncbi:hypothetical protein [Streptomyces niveus]|uniref:hypothetical protein n=1 Tax=Streptomyces niveus TaxID=193462 RepID=UPI003450BCAC